MHRFPESLGPNSKLRSEFRTSCPTQFPNLATTLRRETPMQANLVRAKNPTRLTI